MIARDAARLNPETLIPGVPSMGLLEMLRHVVRRVINGIRYWHVVWVVSIEPQAWRGHWVMRVRERRPGQKRLLLDYGFLDKRDRAISNKRRRVKFRVVGSSIDLPPTLRPVAPGGLSLSLGPLNLRLGLLG